jgi:cytochrome c oxidase subunit II
MSLVRIGGAALALFAMAGPAAAGTYPITASKYEFIPAEITVDEGETVVLEMRSTDVEHGLEIKELKLKVAIPKTGETVRAEFVAKKAGTFSFKCSEYCGNGHSRMKGKLVVRPKAAAASTQEKR